MRVRWADFYRYGGSLSTHPDGPVDAYAVGHALGVPSSTLAGWLRQLRFHRALSTTSEGEVVDRPRLHQFYTAHRIARIDPIAEIHVDLSAGELADDLQRENIPHALAMLSAANAWAFYEDRQDVQLYVNRRDVPRIRGRLARGRTRVQLFAENLDDLPTARRGRMVTDAFLTMIDCRAHPEGGAYADFLDRNVLRRTPRAPRA